VRPPTFRERLRYALDNVLARGTAVLIAGLFVTLAVAVLLVALVLTLTGAGGDGAPQGFGGLLWHNLLRTLDPGTMADDEGPVAFLASMLVVTLIGVFAFSALVGILSTGLESRFAKLRKGRSRVIERGHIVVLGWSPEIFTVLSELVTANANSARSVITVLADRDKVEMEDEIRSRLGSTGRTKIICRRGNPADVDDIDIASVQTSRAVIVLSPVAADADADVLKTLLALVNDPDRRPEPYHIVAEVQNPANAEAAKLIGRDEVELVVADHTISKIIAQTCRQSGLSVVYTELLNFSGDEIYLVSEPRLAQTTFGDALLAFEHSTLIGLHDGRTRLNPPADTVIEREHRLIVITADDDTTTVAAERAGVDESLIGAVDTTPPGPERTLVLGWNHRGAEIIAELDKYVAPGSSVDVVADAPRTGDDLESIRGLLHNTEISCTVADSGDRRRLDEMDLGRYDHVVVLSYADDAEVQHADARTLTTLIHLRDIATTTGASFSITSEILDVRNRQLGEAAKPDDFIVSNHIVSLLLAQIAENKAAGEIFADLLSAHGDEIYLRPAGDYVTCGASITFATVVESARRRGEVALGFRRAALSDRPDEHYGVAFNPPKSHSIEFAADDKIIVLARG
jgi:voltage-gated potassium channel Kch